MKRLIGIEQWRTRKQRSTFRQAVMRPIRVLAKPTVFISTIYYLLTFAWVVGINTTLSISSRRFIALASKTLGEYKLEDVPYLRHLADFLGTSTSRQSSRQYSVKSLDIGSMIQ